MSEPSFLPKNLAILRINKITVGKQYRKDLDLYPLMEDMKKNGQLVPIMVSDDHHLIWGYRRLEAARALGWEKVSACIASMEELQALEAIASENLCRQAPSISDRVALAKAIEERIGSRQGQRTDRTQLPHARGEVPNGVETKEYAAKAHGFGSSEEFRRAAKVVENGVVALVEAMNAKQVSIYDAFCISDAPKPQQHECLELVRTRQATTLANALKIVRGESEPEPEPEAAPVAPAPAEAEPAADEDLDDDGFPKPDVGEPVGEASGAAAEPLMGPGSAPERNGKHEPEPESPPVDGWGIPIQPHAVEAFARVPKFQEMLTLARRLRNLYAELAEEPGGELLQRPGIGVNVSEKWRHNGLKTFIANLEDCMPRYTACPYAHNPDAEHRPDCTLCHGRGWVGAVPRSRVPEALIAATKAAFGVEDKAGV